jgi:hypothetical protein
MLEVEQVGCWQNHESCQQAVCTPLLVDCWGNAMVWADELKNAVRMPLHSKARFTGYLLRLLGCRK